MTLMRTVIETPELTYWATEPGNVLDPDDTSGDAVPVVKEAGWNAGMRPPARIENWLQNLAHQWHAKTMSLAVSNWVTNTDIAAVPNIRTLEYNASDGVWYANDASVNVWKSFDGRRWSSAGVLGNTGLRRSAGHDTSRIIVGDSNSDLEYSSSATLASWSTITAATMGIASDVYGICTKAPVSDFLIISTRGAGIKIAASGVTGGSWVSPSTAPSGVGTGGLQDAQRLIYMGGTTWGLLSSTYSGGVAFGYFISTDDGDNWTAGTLDFTAYSGGATRGPRDMAYSEDTGRLVVCGRDNAGPTRITYSDDLGVSWTRSVVAPWLVAGTQPEPRVLYYCGADIWIASTDWNTTTPDVKEPGLIISTDNAETWDTLNMDGVATDRSMSDFACDGKMLVGAGAAGMVMSSLAIA